jgi:hypothetical protein
MLAGPFALSDQVELSDGATFRGRTVRAVRLDVHGCTNRYDRPMDSTPRILCNLRREFHDENLSCPDIDEYALSAT